MASDVQNDLADLRQYLDAAHSKQTALEAKSQETLTKVEDLELRLATAVKEKQV